MKDIKLKDIMIKNVAVISEEEKVTSAARIMSKKNIGSILVVDGKDPIGILTEKDLLNKVVALGKDPNDLFVRDIMTTSLFTVDPEENVFKAFTIMTENHFRRLPVVKDNKLLGIVTETDLSRAMSDYGSNINPTIEKPSSENIKHISETFDLKDGASYVLVEDKQDKVYDAFVSRIAEGYAGMGILRVSPDKIKAQYGLKKTFMVWLTEIKGEGCIQPTELEKLMFTITSFIENAEKSIILFDGVEYIESYTSFQQVFHLLQTLVDRVSLSKSIMLISMDRKTFDDKELHLLERGLKVLSY